LWPHRDRCSGGFAAALRLVSELPEPSERADSYRSAKEPKANRQRGRRSEVRSQRPGESDWPVFLDALGQIHAEVRIGERAVSLLESGLSRWLSPSSDAFQPSWLGLLVGKHQEPTHALAMACMTNFSPNETLSCDGDEARRYLQGESFSGKDDGVGGNRGLHAQGGWSVLHWRGRPLGWVKRSSGKWKNHLPVWARLRVDASTIGGQIP
jgi:NOL1/NOP2/fmu family ribosome biogenesis protein